MIVEPFSDPIKVTWRNSASVLKGTPALVYHADKRMIAPLVEGMFVLHMALASFAAEKGLRVIVLHSSPASRALVDVDDRHLHVFMDNKPGYRRNLFHSIPSYLHGFWYFDELAPRNNSLIRLGRFDRRAVHPPYATKVLTRLRYKYVEQNWSKFEQPSMEAHALEPDSLVYFAQNFMTPHLYPDYLQQDQMLRAAIAAKGARRLYIKPHPIQKDNTLEWIHGLHDPTNGVEVVNASVHALNAAAAATISLTSACSFEGFIQRRPAVLGGQADFHHNAITLTRPDKMAEAIEATLERDWPYAQYMTWFLKHNCVEDRADSLPDVLERIYKKGFRWADTGDTGFY